MKRTAVFFALILAPIPAVSGDWMLAPLTATLSCHVQSTGKASRRICSTSASSSVQPGLVSREACLDAARRLMPETGWKGTRTVLACIDSNTGQAEFIIQE